MRAQPRTPAEGGGMPAQGHPWKKVHVTLIYNVGTSSSGFGAKAEVQAIVLGKEAIVKTTQLLDTLRRDQAPLSENPNVRILAVWEGEEVWTLLPLGHDATITLTCQQRSGSSEFEAVEPVFLLLTKSGMKVPYIELLLGNAISRPVVANPNPVIQEAQIAELHRLIKESHGAKVALEVSDAFYPLCQAGWRERRPTGVLFHGPPGTGKSTICQAILKCLAADEQCILFNGVAAQLNEKYVGESEKRLRGMTDLASAYPNKVFFVFLDEVHGLAKKQLGGKSSDHKLDTLLSLLEVISSQRYGNIIFLFATNFKEMLDPAFLRSKRVDKPILVPSLSWDQRVASSTIEDREFFALLTSNFVLAQMQSFKHSQGGVASEGSVLFRKQVDWQTALCDVGRKSPSTSLFAEWFRGKSRGDLISEKLAVRCKDICLFTYCLDQNQCSILFGGSTFLAGSPDVNIKLQFREKVRATVMGVVKADVVVSLSGALVDEMGEGQFPAFLKETVSQALFDGVKTLFFVDFLGFLGGVSVSVGANAYYGTVEFPGPARPVALAAIANLLEDVSQRKSPNLFAFVNCAGLAEVKTAGGYTIYSSPFTDLPYSLGTLLPLGKGLPSNYHELAL